MNRAYFHCVVSVGFILTGNSGAQVTSAEQSSEFHQTVVAARGWLNANLADRTNFEADLKKYDGDIDAIISAILPRGSDAFKEIKGREVKGDTFKVPELLARNEDHPFNYYVPPHYDPAKPMGLVIWMHGGGTYKPGKKRKKTVDREQIRGTEVR